MITKELFENSESVWLGMSDYRLILNESSNEIVIRYIGEPPHGDSYHQIELNGKLLKGYYWGCMFLFPSKQRYMIASWMEKLFDRKTIVVDLELSLYTVLENYWDYYQESEGEIILKNRANDDFETLKFSSIYDWEELF